VCKGHAQRTCAKDMRKGHAQARPCDEQKWKQKEGVFRQAEREEHEPGPGWVGITEVVVQTSAGKRGQKARDRSQTNRRAVLQLA
jgi:hypothetical protein